MEKPFYKATVNDELEVELSENDVLDMVVAGPGRFHIIQGHRSFEARVLQADFARKEVQVKVNGEVYRIILHDRFDQLVDELGFSSGEEQRIDEIKAPMPGLVLQIMVKEGQEVSPGDTLLILEAMKMENVIKSPGAGTVSEIVVNPGQAVEKAQVLLRLD